MEGKPFYLPPTLGDARSPHGGANVEIRWGECVRRETAGRDRDGQGTRNKCETILMKTDTSVDEDCSPSEDKRRKKKTNKKTNAKRNRKN